MKIFALPMAFAASMLASIAWAEAPGDIEGHWGTGWKARGLGSLELTATTAGDISEVYLEAFYWQEDQGRSKCKYISRLNETGQTKEVHQVTNEGNCPSLSSWTLARAGDHQTKIVFDKDIFNLAALGVEEILLNAGNRAVLPHEADSEVPQTDLLGFTLGMTPEDFAALATEKGYEQDGRYWVREPFTDRNFKEDYRERLNPSFAPVVDRVDYEGAGTLMELGRISQPEPEASMHADAMIGLIKKKYGEPTKLSEWENFHHWHYPHGDIETPLADGEVCNSNDPTSDTAEHCSHSLSMNYEVDREQKITEVTTSLSDRDLDRRSRWAQTLASLHEKLESQIAVFESGNTLEF